MNQGRVVVYRSDELAHYGKKGMKWGRRKAMPKVIPTFRGNKRKPNTYEQKYLKKGLSPEEAKRKGRNEAALKIGTGVALTAGLAAAAVMAKKGKYPAQLALGTTGNVKMQDLLSGASGLKMLPPASFYDYVVE
jgi:hypothetical protein